MTLLYSDDLPKTLRKKIEGKQTRLPKENDEDETFAPCDHRGSADGRDRWTKMGKNATEIEDERSKKSTSQQNCSRERAAEVSAFHEDG